MHAFDEAAVRRASKELEKRKERALSLGIFFDLPAASSSVKGKDRVKALCLAQAHHGDKGKGDHIAQLLLARLRLCVI